ncbi:Uncharacterised protein [Enterococcus gallinarum]|uniref:Uncharacterized protein n=1 Tax=Enterococcus gallinarum TaxID=1353 RepID=A0A376GYY8_ENTGA|nr:Uncharacterised protein [Enterococcus gallinarum]STD82134.1 Uncharacterised protein [Enterococcus gallinarum]
MYEWKGIMVVEVSDEILNAKQEKTEDVLTTEEDFIKNRKK